MLTRLISEEVNLSFSISRKEQDGVRKVKEYCPPEEWMHDYATLSPWDYVDIFRAPDMAGHRLGYFQERHRPARKKPGGRNKRSLICP